MKPCQKQKKCGYCGRVFINRAGNFQKLPVPQDGQQILQVLYIALYFVHLGDLICVCMDMNVNACNGTQQKCLTGDPISVAGNEKLHSLQQRVSQFAILVGQGQYNL